MKALTFDPASDVFAVRALPVPTPGPGDVLVKVAACGLNPVDVTIARWKTMAPDMAADWTPGLDVSGEIALFQISFYGFLQECLVKMQD